MKRKRLPRPHRVTREWLIPPPLLQSRKTVLFALAKQGPLNTYQIAKKTGKTYSLTFNSVKELEQREMVKLKGKKSTIKGTTANIYDLTLRGVLFVLKQEFARTVMQKYASLLPLIFGKLNYFNKMGLEKMAFYRLKFVLASLGRLDDPRISKPEKTLEQRIYQAFFFFGFFPPRPEWEGSGIMMDPKAWTNVWRQDEDIRTWVVQDLGEYLAILEKAVTYVRKALLFLEEAQS